MTADLISEVTLEAPNAAAEDAPPPAPSFDELPDIDKSYITYAFSCRDDGALYREIADTNGQIVERWLRLYNRCFFLKLDHVTDDLTPVKIEIVSLVHHKPATADEMKATFRLEGLHGFNAPDDPIVPESIRMCDETTQGIFSAGGLRSAWRVLRCTVADPDHDGVNYTGTWAVDFCVPAVSKAAAEAQTGGLSTWEQDDAVVKGVFQTLIAAAKKTLGSADADADQDAMQV